MWQIFTEVEQVVVSAVLHGTELRQSGKFNVRDNTDAK